MVYYVYLIGAFLCFIGELFTMDFSLSCFGLGLFGSALLSWLGLGLGWQVGVFVVLSLAFFISIRPLALKHLYHKNVKTNVDALVGCKVVVHTAPDPADQIGRVVIDGDNWRAQFSVPLKVGEEARVQKIDGNTLFVAPIQETKEEK